MSDTPLFNCSPTPSTGRPTSPEATPFGSIEKQKMYDLTVTILFALYPTSTIPIKIRIVPNLNSLCATAAYFAFKQRVQDLHVHKFCLSRFDNATTEYLIPYDKFQTQDTVDAMVTVMQNIVACIPFNVEFVDSRKNQLLTK